MANRAERRARAKSSRTGENNQYTRGGMKSRRGVIDEMSLQEKSRRLASGEDGEWKPTGHHDFEPNSEQADPNLRDPKIATKPHSVRQWLRIICWALIVLSAIAFLVAMWLPNVPTWATITICAVFALGVISLFFVGGSYKENPRLDAYGTAV